MTLLFSYQTQVLGKIDQANRVAPDQTALGAVCNLSLTVRGISLQQGLLVGIFYVKI